MQEVTAGRRQPARSFTLEPRPRFRLFAHWRCMERAPVVCRHLSRLLPPIRDSLLSLGWTVRTLSSVLGPPDI